MVKDYLQLVNQVIQKFMSCTNRNTESMHHLSDFSLQPVKNL